MVSIQMCSFILEQLQTNTVAEKDPTYVESRGLHPVASVAWVFRNLGGGRAPENESRTVGGSWIKRRSSEEIMTNFTRPEKSPVWSPGFLDFPALRVSSMFITGEVLVTRDLLVTSDLLVTGEVLVTSELWPLVIL